MIAKATASFVTIPAEVKTSTPAPAWVAAPAALLWLPVAPNGRRDRNRGEN